MRRPRGQAGLVAVERRGCPATGHGLQRVPLSPARVERRRPADLGLLMSLAEDQVGEDQPTWSARPKFRGVARRLLVRQYPEVAVIAAEEFAPSYRLLPMRPGAAADVHRPMRRRCTPTPRRTPASRRQARPL
jgi:hypothetical protein